MKCELTFAFSRNHPILLWSMEGSSKVSKFKSSFASLLLVQKQAYLSFEYYSTKIPHNLIYKPYLTVQIKDMHSGALKGFSYTRSLASFVNYTSHQERDLLLPNCKYCPFGNAFSQWFFLLFLTIYVKYSSKLHGAIISTLEIISILWN